MVPAAPAAMPPPRALAASGRALAVRAASALAVSAVPVGVAATHGSTTVAQPKTPWAPVGRWRCRRYRRRGRRSGGDASTGSGTATGGAGADRVNGGSTGVGGRGGDGGAASVTNLGSEATAAGGAAGNGGDGPPVVPAATAGTPALLVWAVPERVAAETVGSAPLLPAASAVPAARLVPAMHPRTRSAVLAVTVAMAPPTVDSAAEVATSLPPGPGRVIPAVGGNGGNGVTGAGGAGGFGGTARLQRRHLHIHRERGNRRHRRQRSNVRRRGRLGRPSVDSHPGLVRRRCWRQRRRGRRRIIGGGAGGWGGNVFNWGTGTATGGREPMGPAAVDRCWWWGGRVASPACPTMFPRHRVRRCGRQWRRRDRRRAGGGGAAR